MTALRTRRWTLAALALAVLLTVATACGGDDDAAQPAEPAAVTPAAASATSAPPATQTAPTAAPEPTATPEARMTGEVDGVTFVVGEGSEATFTVGEVLARVPLPIQAVMRTEELSGEVHLDGRESRVTIDLQTLTSDQSNRDRWSRNRLFGQHPMGVFILPDATPLPAGFAEGDTVTTQVTGTLEVLGQALPVTFDIEARDDGDRIVILGRSSFTWDDIGVPTPTSPAVVSVEDTVFVNVLIEARPE